MIASSQNAALLIVAEKASLNPLWIDYAEYCRLREKGLRKQSFEKINNFIKIFNQFEFNQKKEFTAFIFELAETVEDAYYGPLPHQLRVSLKEVLIDWINEESEDSAPLRWLAEFFNERDYLIKALEVDPHDDRAREVLISDLIADISYSTHHLPDYYIGNADENLQKAELARQHIYKLTDEDAKNYLIKDLEEELKLVKSYFDWKNSGSTIDFQDWAKRNQRSFDSGVTAYYYDE